MPKTVPVDDYHVDQVVEAVDTLCGPYEKNLVPKLNQRQLDTLEETILRLQRWIRLYQ